ncbi:hypothetical protein LA080_004013 [Diaporthe eres]|nr:hypothetical protein LA080_004013 [Diaporthe eres]
MENLAHTTGSEKHVISESTDSEVSDDEISETLFEVLLLPAQHMPEARIQSVDTSDPQSSEELLCRLGMYGAGECDLIHMQDWTVAANFIHDLPHEIYRSSPGNSDEHALGAHFAELLLLALEFIENVAIPSSEPLRSSRIGIIKEIRAVLSVGVDSRIHFMNLVRITAQKPKEKLDGQ